MTSGSELEDLNARLTSALAQSYEVGELIGAGAMGAVFAARDRRHGRNVAIKVIRPVFASSMIATRFVREIRISAGLHHPHILPLFDSGEADGLLYYVSPLVTGESLRTRIDRERRLPLLDVCHIIRQVAAALTHAHRASIVHRDVKPDNILLAEGNAFVADFGIAKAMSEADEGHSTTTGIAVGTPRYMSPEQASGESVDGRTDQYALACVAYEMIAGEPPFGGDTARTIIAKHISQPPPGIRSLRSAVSEDAERVLKRGLAKSPADRFESAVAFAEALERTLAGMPVPTSRSDPSAAVVRTHAGRLVSKTCDRWQQVNEFDSFLRTSRAATPGRPQLYLLPGEEGDAHDSLLERLVHTTLSRFAEEIGGFERGTVGRLRTPWPDSDDLESAKRDLSIGLLRESDPSYLGDDLSCPALVNSLGRKPHGVIVMHHDLRARHLKRFTPDLVEWYANEYWGALHDARPRQQFIVFLKLIYPARRAFNVAAMLGLVPDARRVQRALQERLTRPGLRTACLVFKELQQLTMDDVSEWFSSNGIIDSERRRMELAHSIFEGNPRRNMAHVEAALEEIHRTFVNEQHIEFGSTS